MPRRNPRRGQNGPQNGPPANQQGEIFAGRLTQLKKDLLVRIAQSLNIDPQNHNTCAQLRTSISKVLEDSIDEYIHNPRFAGLYTLAQQRDYQLNHPPPGTIDHQIQQPANPNPAGNNNNGDDDDDADLGPYFPRRRERAPSINGSDRSWEGIRSDREGSQPPPIRNQDRVQRPNREVNHGVDIPPTIAENVERLSRESTPFLDQQQGNTAFSKLLSAFAFSALSLPAHILYNRIMSALG